MEKNENEERSTNLLSNECRVVTLGQGEINVIGMVMMKKLWSTKIEQTQCRSTEYFYHIRDLYSAKLAFCKLFKVYPYMLSDEQYPGYDVMISLRYKWGEERKTVDVKQTSYNDGKLTADIRGKIFDLYVLMVGQFPRFVYRGSILREMLFRPENIETIGGKQIYAVEQDHLSMTFPFFRV